MSTWRTAKRRTRCDFRILWRGWRRGLWGPSLPCILLPLSLPLLLFAISSFPFPFSLSPFPNTTIVSLGERWDVHLYNACWDKIIFHIDLHNCIGPYDHKYTGVPEYYTSPDINRKLTAHHSCKINKAFIDIRLRPGIATICLRTDRLTDRQTDRSTQLSYRGGVII